MAEVKWINLTTGMFEDEKIMLMESLPDADTIIIIWVKLICLAGKINDGGFIYFKQNLPYTDEMLSTIFRRPISTIRLALETFKRFGMVDILENGVITLPNWEKHQMTDGLMRIREHNNERQRRYREKIKDTSVTLQLRDGSVSVTEQSKEKKSKEKKSKSIEKDACSLTPAETEIYESIIKLPEWKSSYTDMAWVSELMRVYPMVTVGMIHKCRDWHIEKHPTKKHNWKTALRNWLEKEKQISVPDGPDKFISGSLGHVIQR